MRLGSLVLYENLHPSSYVSSIFLYKHCRWNEVILSLLLLSLYHNCYMIVYPYLPALIVDCHLLFSKKNKWLTTTHLYSDFTSTNLAAEMTALKICVKKLSIKVLLHYTAQHKRMSNGQKLFLSGGCLFLSGGNVHQLPVQGKRTETESMQ
jgi:hypothetical protein